MRIAAAAIPPILLGMKTLDFRSDTVTRPSPGMRQAIAQAEVGDDVFSDDPTVNRLEERLANLFGVEAALFVPSGTMGNQICIKVHTQPGEEMLCDRECHVVNYEVGGPVQHAGVMVNLLTTERGMLTPEMVTANLRPKSLHSVQTTLVTVENTHNRHGGAVLPHSEVIRLGHTCHELGLRYHLDGARIWNAHAASGVPLAELIAPFDSASVCFSKGLGAPVGSAILASRSFIDTARRERKLFGGGLRQAGLLAAAVEYALEHNLSRLQQDHENARRLANGLSNLSWFELDPTTVETNIVIVRVGQRSPTEVVARLAEAGVLVVPFGTDKIRLVTHLDLSAADCEEALKRIATVLSRAA